MWSLSAFLPAKAAKKETLIRHPLLGEVLLVRTARARRIALTVKPSGAVRLSFPPTVSQRRAAAFIDEKVEWILKARARMQQRAAACPHLSPAEVEELRRRAKAELPARVEELARRFGFRCGRVTIRAARTKWGSCTGRNDLSLSLYLMALPEHLRDFVVLHELCHTVHHDHSPLFHALLDRCVGGREKELIRELRGYRPC